MTTHYLKTWPDYFQGVATGEISAQLRKNDRHYRTGDTLYLMEYDPKKKRHSGRYCRIKVVGMIQKIKGLQKGYCILSTGIAHNACGFNPKLAGKP